MKISGLLQRSVGGVVFLRGEKEISGFFVKCAKKIISGRGDTDLSGSGLLPDTGQKTSRRAEVKKSLFHFSL